MSKKIKYTDEPMDVKVVKNFLPSPAELVPIEESVKITISLKKSSVDFFKENAAKHHTKYQKMIRSVLDEYARLYSELPLA
jgi:predicted DNA binding CopG/RHH family protein